MKKLVLLFTCASIALACGSPSVNNGASSAKTNVNAVNSAPYSQTENAYTFAQNSILARDLTSSGKGAREIVGKTVSESKLWQNKAFSGRLRKLMGRDYATMRKFWNVETPIEKFGDFLMMTGCEKNNCADNRYVIFMDLGDGNINVVHIGKGILTREWKGYGQIALPPPFAQELSRIKAHK
jgi:hypothetical protein